MYKVSLYKNPELVVKVFPIINIGYCFCLDFSSITIPFVPTLSVKVFSPRSINLEWLMIEIKLFIWYRVAVAPRYSNFVLVGGGEGSD